MTDRIYYSREAEVQAQRERTTAVFAFFLIGITIGTVIALLFAPRSGEKTRAEIADALEDSFQDGRKASGDAIEKLEKDFADLRKRVEDRR
jgi:gas vesicle protein